jgi:hypothetical protein
MVVQQTQTSDRNWHHSTDDAAPDTGNKQWRGRDAHFRPSVMDGETQCLGKPSASIKQAGTSGSDDRTKDPEVRVTQQKSVASVLRRENQLWSRTADPKPHKKSSAHTAKTHQFSRY